MIEKKRILVLGCGGMLGDAVYHTLKAKNKVLATDIHISEDWLEFLDVRDADSIAKTCVRFSPDIIINLAAITDIEYCETHREESYATNSTGQENVCAIAAKLDIPVVYISTAGVFDGEKKSYTDDDLPNPISVYGKSKYLGEQCTVQTLKKYFVFRAGWMMGGGVKKDKKFIKRLYDQLQFDAKELFVTNDTIGNPTYTWDFAGAVAKIVATSNYGLYNMVCEGSCTRFDMAKAFVQNLNLSESVKVTAVNSNYFTNDFYVLRPKSENLVNQKLKEKNMLFMRDWQTCLKEYSQQFNNFSACSSLK